MSDFYSGTDLFSEFDRLQRQMANLFGTFPSSLRASRLGAFPPVNIGATDDSIQIVAFAPGVNAAELDVSIDKGLLTISGERKPAQPDTGEDSRVYAQERFTGAFRRVIELFVDRTEAERTTLGDALDRYEREIVPTKRYPNQERTRIARWKKNDLAWRALANLRGADFAKYRDARRAAGRAENTIRLELQVISHLFEIARKEWGFETLMNPLKNIRKPSGSRARDRRLRPGEFDALRSRLAASLNPWAAPAFELAIETSLRQGTLFSLRWEWIKLPDRMIEFPPEARGADNKGVPARLPLTRRAVAVLRALAAHWQRDRLTDRELCRFGPVDVNPSDLTGPVFGTSCNAVLLVWKRVVKDKENGLPDLRWHDLRHEAASRLFEKGLHPLEVASITGHRSMQMLKRYTHLNPADLLGKLG